MKFVPAVSDVYRSRSGSVIIAICLFILLPPGAIAGESETFDRPNILWLTFEDSSYNHLSAYGNPHVRMPRVDRLAERGITFTQARATAPHCSPARSSLISGSYATTYGTDWHRKEWPVPDNQYYFPRLLKEAGYFTTNNRKRDYNVNNWHEVENQVWSQQGNHASYNADERDSGQPFFSIFNQTSTHMSRIRTFNTSGRDEFDGFTLDQLELPGYLPDLDPIRSDYGVELEGLNELDDWIAGHLDHLEKRGLADDTIVLFFSDHGGPLPCAKGYPYDVGLRVPLLVYVPPRWRDRVDLPMGKSSDRLVGFEDLGPTVLRLAGLDVPEYMQGRDVLTTDAEPKPYQYNFRTNHGRHFFPTRSVTDGRYRYVRFYVPHKPTGLKQRYQWGNPGYQAWDRLCHEFPRHCPDRFQRWFQPTPTEYLFDLREDPWEMKNLANDPEYRNILKRLRRKVSEHLRRTKDLGLFPRSTRKRTNGQPLYEWVRETDYPLETLYTAAETASQGTPEHKEKLVQYLKSDRPELRFWGASGLATLGQRGKMDTAPSELIEATEDSNIEVKVTAAHALCYLDRPEQGMEVILNQFRKGRWPSGSAIQTLAEVRPEVVRPYVDQLKKHKNAWSARAALIDLGVFSYNRLYPDKTETTLERHNK